jgi:hypothetical protein
MMTRTCCRPLSLILCLLALVIVLAPQIAIAQESKSVPLAAELTRMLDQSKLDAVAARHPQHEDQYVAALYFPGTQLLVVSATYSVPYWMDDKLTKKEYRDAYIDLNSASIPESKVFVEDLGADGLRTRREENQPFDIYETPNLRIAFDGDWRKHKMSEQDYMKAFQDADEKYANMLSILLTHLKKKGS